MIIASVLLDFWLWPVIGGLIVGWIRLLWKVSVLTERIERLEKK